MSRSDLTFQNSHPEKAEYAYQIYGQKFREAGNKQERMLCVREIDNQTFHISACELLSREDLLVKFSYRDIKLIVYAAVEEILTKERKALNHLNQGRHHHGDSDSG